VIQLNALIKEERFFYNAPKRHKEEKNGEEEALEEEGA